MPNILHSFLSTIPTTRIQDSSRLHGKRAYWIGLGCVLAMTFCVAPIDAAAQTRTATSTSLAVTSGGSGVTSVTAGSVVTLTATVNAGTPRVTQGQVNFCDASAAHCTDIHILGTAQITSAGSASIKLRPVPGSYRYKAQFVGTMGFAASASAASGLSVTGKHPSTTNITQSGYSGNYSLTATVSGSSMASSGPTGTVSFIDTTANNAVLSTASLGTPSFAALGLISSPVTGGEPDTIVAGDFNQDGTLDLAVGLSPYVPAISVLLGDGSGNFTQTAASPISTTGIPLLVQDFNGDGYPDILLEDQLTGQLTVLLGNGDGTFKVAPGSPFYTNYGTYPVVAGDFNGDGIPDIAVAGGYYLIIMLGKGDGSFTELSPTGNTLYGSLLSLAAEDLNGDGLTDLVIASGNKLLVYLSNGDGTFNPAGPTPSLNGATQFALGDFNGDGKLDLALASYGTGNNVGILLGNGDGTFQDPSTYPITIGSTPFLLAVGDFNGDGIADLFLGAQVNGTTMNVLLGKGDGTFSLTSTGSVSLPCCSDTVLGDFNGDRVTDVASSSFYDGDVQVLFGNVSQATATVDNINVVGPGTDQVNAQFPGDLNFLSSTSSSTALVSQVAAPVLSPPPGVYTSVQTVTITDSSPGSTIYYSSPSTNGFVAYSGPFTLSTPGPQLLQVYATAPGSEQSNYVNAEYTLILPQAPTPVLSLAAGTYPAAQSVTLSDTLAGAQIYYTTDGSAPTANSTLYSGPIIVSSSETVIAVAVANGYSFSPPVVGQYLITSSSVPLIYTLAGSELEGYAGDGGPATQAQLSLPFSAVKDASGNIYIAEESNHVVRKVAAGTGVISTLAGNGTVGYSGDGGPSTSAVLSFPSALALDKLGNLFIADLNGTVREINLSTGMISTYAGDYGATTSTGNLATQTPLPQIYGIAIDGSRNVYLSVGSFYGQILEITDSTRTISTLAGTTSYTNASGDGGPASNAKLYYPHGLAFDGNGNLYVADTYDHAVREIAASGGVVTSSSIITTVAGIFGTTGYTQTGGPATSVGFYYPEGIAVDGSNNLYIADNLTSLIWEVNASTGIMTKISGELGQCSSYSGDGGPAVSAAVCSPVGLSIDAAGDVLIAEAGYNRVREVSAAAPPPTTQAAAPTFSLSPGTYSSVQTVTLADTTPGASIYVTFDGSTPTTGSKVYSAPIPVAGAMTIKAVAVAPGYLTSAPVSATYAITTFEPIISTIAGNGTAGFAPGVGLTGLGNSGPWANVEFEYPRGMAIDQAGNIYVVDESNQIVWEFSASTGNATVVAGTGYPGSATSGILATNATLYNPTAIAVDSAGNLYIVDTGNDVVREVVAATGMIYTVAGRGTSFGPSGDGGPATSAFLVPAAIALDSQNNLYISDTDHYSVREVSAQTGIITTVAGNGSYAFGGDGGPATQAGLETPSALAVSPGGDIYVASNSTRVRKVSASTGNISTVAGYADIDGIAGDGGPATSAQIVVSALALDSAGNLYIGNGPGAIREVNANTGIITRVAGVGLPGFSGDSGPALSAQLYGPVGIAFDPSSNLIFTDEANLRIRKINFTPQVVATPAISLATGTYIGPQSVTITDATPGATIYYTTDGSTPTPASTVYSGAIKVSAAETVKAIAEAVNYNQSALASAAYIINRITPTITWTTPAAITYGTALGANQLNATASVPGAFVYTPAAGTVLTAGSQSLSVTFTPTDTIDYATVTAGVTLVVNQVTPAITWATPAAIVFGTALSSAQLNATASVPGSFVYSPASGTVPAVGSDTLSVTFTPTDATDYTTATAKVTLAVNEPVPAISSLSPVEASAGGAGFTLSINGTGFNSATTAFWGSTALTIQSVSATQLTAQVPASAIVSAGTDAITVQNPTPGGGASNPFQFAVVSASSGTPPSFTTLTASVAPGSTASYPVTLSSSATNVSVTCLNLPAGATCTYSASTGAVTIATTSTTPAGSYQITVIFTETVPSTSVSMPLVFLLLLPLMFLRRRLQKNHLWLTVCLAISIAFATFVTGCGGSGGSGGGSGGGSTIQVTTAASVTLTVQ